MEEKGIKLKDAHKYYYSKRKGTKHKPVNHTIFSKVLIAFNTKLIDYVVEYGAMQLPYNLGILRITCIKQDLEKLKVDFNETRKLGMTVYHDNRHTDGHYCEYNWVRLKYAVRNIRHYNFIPARGNKGKSPKEKLTKALKTPGKYKSYVLIKRKKYD